MALTNSGFDGTVTEAAWANMSALTDMDAVESSAAWAITQGTGRQVSTAAHSGYAFARGVLSKDTSAILTGLGTPVDGQWFLICRHINWSTNAVTVVAVAHSTTSTTIPTVAPATFPTIDNNPGVLYDQKLGWAWVRSTDTTVTLFDLRTFSAEARALGTKQSYTPTLTGITIGNGTAIGTSTRNGQMVFDEIIVTLGSTSSVTGGVVISSLPVPGLSVELMAIGSVNIHDSGTAFYAAVAMTQSATSISIRLYTTTGAFADNNGTISSTSPMTWAVGDQIIVSTQRIAA
jgi:hypothetical protein